MRRDTLGERKIVCIKVWRKVAKSHGDDRQYHSKATERSGDSLKPNQGYSQHEDCIPRLLPRNRYMRPRDALLWRQSRLDCEPRRQEQDSCNPCQDQDAVTKPELGQQTGQHDWQQYTAES